MFSNMTNAASNLMSSGGGQSTSEGGAGNKFEDGNFDAYANFANAILDRAVLQAIPYTEQNTRFAMEAAQNYYQQARQDLQKYYEQGRIDAKQYTALANAQLKPYVEAGYTALDQTMDILGMPRFSAGSSAVAAAQTNQANQQAARDQLKQAGYQLLNSLPQLDPQSRANLIGTINAGGDPNRILEGLQEIGITQGQPKYRTDFQNPSVRTMGLSMGGQQGAQNSPAAGQMAGMFAGQGGNQNLPPELRQLGMNVYDNSQPIPSVMGDAMNASNNMLNSLGQNFTDYLINAGNSYQQLQNNTLSPQQAAIIAAMRSGTTGLGRV